MEELEEFEQRFKIGMHPCSKCRKYTVEALNIMGTVGHYYSIRFEDKERLAIIYYEDWMLLTNLHIS